MKSTKKVLTETLNLLSKLPYEKILADLAESSTTTYNPQNDRVQIHFKGDSVFVNDIEVISKKSQKQSQIFSILFDQFIDNYKAGIKTEDFSSINVKQIAKFLEKSNPAKLDPEKHVRWHINQLQQKLRKQFGTEIIESVRWHGYRLNPLAVSIFKTE
jgi:Asp-tRNA(Asn)/Glu-tRNA(Gln) amidotransferase B subunit